MKNYLVIVISILFIGCRTPIEKTEAYSFYLKIDDNSTLIIVNEALDKTYTYHNYAENKIDITTLEERGAFLIDKYRVYQTYQTSDETLLVASNAIDRESFVHFENSMYGKDKDFVYDNRHGVIEAADVESFEAISLESNGRIAYGKDKNNYFFGHKTVIDTIGFGKVLHKN